MCVCVYAHVYLYEHFYEILWILKKIYQNESLKKNRQKEKYIYIKNSKWNSDYETMLRFLMFIFLYRNLILYFFSPSTFLSVIFCTSF